MTFFQIEHPRKVKKILSKNIDFSFWGTNRTTTPTHICHCTIVLILDHSLFVESKLSNESRLLHKGLRDGLGLVPDIRFSGTTRIGQKASWKRPPSACSNLKNPQKICKKWRKTLLNLPKNTFLHGTSKTPKPCCFGYLVPSVTWLWAFDFKQKIAEKR